MNHGYCENCWWCKIINPKFTTVTPDGLKEFPCEGQCYMHNHMVNGDSHCPDYINRKKEEKKFGTLDNWIEKIK